jgi:toxin ParE1/3/4
MKVVFRKSALFDIENIHRFIARSNPQAATKVAMRIREATKRLERFPLSGRRGSVEGTHELIVSRLPYIVVYETASETVEVIAVFHAAEDRKRGSQ